MSMHVRELGAQPAGVLDPLRPGDDHAVARAAEVGGALLAPLERRVPGPRPGGRVVRRGRVGAPGVEPAVLVDQRELLLGGEGDPVLHRQLVEGAGQRALQARAVVAEDVDDERVVELAHLLDRVEQAADVPVGVLLEAGVDLHLPRVQLLLARPRASPRREARRASASAPCPAGSRPAPSAARRSPRGAHPSPGRTCRGTSRSTRPRPGAGRASSRSSSRRTTASPGPGRAPGAASAPSGRSGRPASSTACVSVPAGTPRVVLSCVITGSYWPASPPRIPQK